MASDTPNPPTTLLPPPPSPFPERPTMGGSIKVEGSFSARNVEFDSDALRESLALLPENVLADEIVAVDSSLRRFKRGYLRIADDFSERFPALTGVLKSRDGELYLGEDQVGKESDLAITVSSNDYPLLQLTEGARYVASFVPNTVLAFAEEIELTQACTMKLKGGTVYHLSVIARVGFASKPVTLAVREAGMNTIALDAAGDPMDVLISGEKSPETLSLQSVYAPVSDTELYVEISSDAPATILGYSGAIDRSVSAIVVTTDRGRVAYEATLVRLLQSGTVRMEDLIVAGYRAIDPIKQFHRLHPTTTVDLSTTTRLTDKLEIGRLDRPETHERIGWAELGSLAALELNLKTPNAYLLSCVRPTRQSASVNIAVKVSSPDDTVKLRLVVLEETQMIYWTESSNGMLDIVQAIDLRGDAPETRSRFTVIVCAILPEGTENLDADAIVMKLQVDQMLFTLSKQIVANPALVTAPFEIPKDLVVRQKAVRLS